MTTIPPESSATIARVPGAAGTRNFFLEFRRFLDQYGVIGLAIAFIIGAALTDLVKVIVSGLLMPLINPVFALLGGDWKTQETYIPGTSVGPFMLGQVAYAIISFLVIALFVFLVAKYVLKQKEVKKI